MASTNSMISYVEFKAYDLKQTKEFYTSVFGWKFTDYGTTYTAFSESGLEGGFEKWGEPIVNGALVVLYHSNLEEIREKVKNAGAKISADIFKFPGGRRFHFLDPSGNELGVWSDQ